MKTKPLILHPHEVLAAAQGNLRLVVRPMKEQPDSDGLLLWCPSAPGVPYSWDKNVWMDTDEKIYHCPFQPGDVLYGREAARVIGYDPSDDPCEWLKIEYRADKTTKDINIPERFFDDWDMLPCGTPTWVYKKQGIPGGTFKEACRFFFEVEAVVSVRVADILEQDAEERMGIYPVCSYPDPPGTYRVEFCRLWKKTYGENFPWDDNPWTWATSLKQIDKPEGW